MRGDSTDPPRCGLRLTGVPHGFCPLYCRGVHKGEGFAVWSSRFLARMAVGAPSDPWNTLQLVGARIEGPSCGVPVCSPRMAHEASGAERIERILIVLTKDAAGVPSTSPRLPLVLSNLSFWGGGDSGREVLRLLVELRRWRLPRRVSSPRSRPRQDRRKAPGRRGEGRRRGQHRRRRRKREGPLRRSLARLPRVARARGEPVPPLRPAPPGILRTPRAGRIRTSAAGPGLGVRTGVLRSEALTSTGTDGSRVFLR